MCCICEMDGLLTWFKTDVCCTCLFICIKSLNLNVALSLCNWGSNEMTRLLFRIEFVKAWDSNFNQERCSKTMEIFSRKCCRHKMHRKYTNVVLLSDLAIYMYIYIFSHSFTVEILPVVIQHYFLPRHPLHRACQYCIQEFSLDLSENVYYWFWAALN